VKRLALAVLAACGDNGATAMPDGAVADAAPDAATPATYSAHAIIGGLDRVVIVKAVGGTCFALRLVSPDNDAGGLTLPAMWGLERATAMQPAAACVPGYTGPIANSFEATAQSGTITFQGAPPASIASVAVTIMFAGAPAWCPPSEMLSATNIAVQ
jgi:hypothetical protein